MTATFWDKEVWKAVKERVWFGTLDPTSKTFCYTIAGIAPLVTGPADEQGQILGNAEEHTAYSQIFQNAFDYFYTMQGSGTLYQNDYNFL